MTAEQERAAVVALKSGQIRWHCSDDDSGPDVGLEFGMPDGSVLWVGEISRSLYEQLPDDGQGEAGWWLVHWKLNGNPNIIGRVSQSWLDFGGDIALSKALAAGASDGRL